MKSSMTKKSHTVMSKENARFHSEVSGQVVTFKKTIINT